MSMPISVAAPALAGNRNSHKLAGRIRAANRSPRPQAARAAGGGRRLHLSWVPAEPGAVALAFDQAPYAMSDQAAASAFRLEDLLGHEELGLKLLTGGPDALHHRLA